MRSEDVNTIKPEAVAREVELALVGNWQTWDENTP